jgi:N-carbamoyl-L-amino-acid hydrolase
VPNGGKYDGAVGVMSAIECVRTLQDQGIKTRHPIEVLDFTNEEGTRFHTWLFGSQAMVGKLKASDLTLRDSEGVSIGNRLKDVGGDIAGIMAAKRSSKELCAYLELHIEQGPVLHQARVPIGVVTAITGRVSLDVTILGIANHAGTTPMANRRDALLAASHLIQAVNAIAVKEEVCRVGTVGIIKASPGAENIIPGRVDLTVEFRDVDMDRLKEAESRFRVLCQEQARRSGVDIEVKLLTLGESKPMSPRLREAIEGAASSLGLKSSALPSGAGHDAQSMADITEAGMIFVPSVDGISHSPKEYSTPEACANGANVLLNTLLALDEQLSR